MKSLLILMLGLPLVAGANESQDKPVTVNPPEHRVSQDPNNLHYRYPDHRYFIPKWKKYNLPESNQDSG